MTDIFNHAHETQIDLTTHFESSLEVLMEKYLGQSQDGGTPSRLADSIRYSLLAPGKRIRPRLLLTCAKMLDLPIEQAMPAAVALEMIHCFTLIHDDLPCMDNDDFRRGRPSNHKKFDESTALLAGDGLMALAIEVFLESPVKPFALHKGLKRLLWALGPRGVIGGQAAEASLNTRSSLNDLKLMHRQKTGALFTAALLLPYDLRPHDLSQMQINNENTQEGKTLASFADALGLAFQMADDLEDEAQGTLLGPESRNPNNVLFYLSPQEASKQASDTLRAATYEVTQIWKEKTQPLATLADEVLEKLKSSCKV